MVIITVHKATDIEKKGLVGKADPYVVPGVNLASFFSQSTMDLYGVLRSNLHTF